MTMNLYGLHQYCKLLATPATSVSTTPHSSQHFLTMYGPTLSSRLAFLERKMCGKTIAITSYFKDELQSLKKWFQG